MRENWIVETRCPFGIEVLLGVRSPLGEFAILVSLALTITHISLREIDSGLSSNRRFMDTVLAFNKGSNDRQTNSTLRILTRKDYAWPNCRETRCIRFTEITEDQYVALKLMSKATASRSQARSGLF